MFLGTYDGSDLYFCTQGVPSGNMPTVIARYGNEEQDYQSGMFFAETPLTDEWHNATLRVAYLIARDLGLLPP